MDRQSYPLCGSGISCRRGLADRRRLGRWQRSGCGRTPSGLLAQTKNAERDRQHDLILRRHAEEPDRSQAVRAHPLSRQRDLATGAQCGRCTA
jgi:hypothetical protein